MTTASFKGKDRDQVKAAAGSGGSFLLPEQEGMLNRKTAMNPEFIRRFTLTPEMKTAENTENLRSSNLSDLCG